MDGKVFDLRNIHEPVYFLMDDDGTMFHVSIVDGKVLKVLLICRPSKGQMAVLPSSHNSIEITVCKKQ